MSAKKQRDESTEKINKTQLEIGKAFKRGIIHRDYNAHFLRFAHVVKQLARNINKARETIVLDVGCGKMELATAIYANKIRVKEYHGADARKIDPVRATFPVKFHQCMVDSNLPDVDPDVVVCFEVIEHMSKEKGQALLDQIAKVSSDRTTIYFSTPCYDGENMAENHIYEWFYDELKEELEKRFTIEKVYGTFMNTKQLKDILPKELLPFYEQMHEFHHSSVLSNLFAPMFPDKSRNAMWVLKKK